MGAAGYVPGVSSDPVHGHQRPLGQEAGRVAGLSERDASLAARQIREGGGVPRPMARRERRRANGGSLRPAARGPLRMNIAFRADASSRMGTGHLMRCLTLGEALRDRGAEIWFITRDHVGNLLQLLQERRFPTAVLPRPTAALGSAEDYGAWLG